MAAATVTARRRHVDPLEVFPPDGERDQLAERALAKLGAEPRYAGAVKDADELVRDSGITLDIERLRDRVERRFGGLQRLVLSQKGVLHRLLLDALEADDLRRAEQERRKVRREEAQRRHDAREEEREAREEEREAREEERKLRQAELEQAAKRDEALLETLTRLLTENQQRLDQNAALLERLLGGSEGHEQASAARRPAQEPALDAATSTARAPRKARQDTKQGTAAAKVAGTAHDAEAEGSDE